MSPRSSKIKAASKISTQSKVTVEKNNKKDTTAKNFIDKIQNDLEKNQSYLNLILGALIVIVLGVLIFNYFNKPSDKTGEVGPSQQMTDEQGDVIKESLPGTYTVKEGDTLFVIAQKYYDDGNKYTEIIKENNLTTDSIATGQKLTIPKFNATANSMAEDSSSASPEAMIEHPSSSPESQDAMSASSQPNPTPAWGKGQATNQTTWGTAITGDSYTVAQGDWLSTIAGRSYGGDIMQYERIAKENNITDPNVIEVGTVLKIPRN